MTEVFEEVTTMLADVRHTITEWLHSIQLDDRTYEGEPIMVPVLPQIDPQKVLIIGFQNAHGRISLMLTISEWK